MKCVTKIKPQFCPATNPCNEEIPNTVWHILRVCDCLNLPFSKELQSFSFSEQYASNPSKQLAWHLEHMGISGLIYLEAQSRVWPLHHLWCQDHLSAGLLIIFSFFFYWFHPYSACMKKPYLNESHNLLMFTINLNHVCILTIYFPIYRCI